MSEIKALEKLREKIRIDVNNPWSDLQGDLLSLCDKVEREIAERYQLLPVDADGVPIRIGDTVCEVDVRVPIEVMSLTFYEDRVDVNVCGMNPNLLCHVKPRTLESILCDALADVSCMGDGIVRTFKQDEPYVAQLAAEIRELLGVGE